MIKKKFILIGHKKRQGKDTFAKMLQTHLEDAEILSFADPMREIMADVFDMSVDDYKELYNKKKGDRERLQRFGSNKMIEYFGEHVWRDVLMRRADKLTCKYIIVADFRFYREIIEEALTVKVINQNVTTVDKHQSETEMNDFAFDINIHNNEGIVELNEKAKGLADRIINGELL